MNRLLPTLTSLHCVYARKMDLARIGAKYFSEGACPTFVVSLGTRSADSRTEKSGSAFPESREHFHYFIS